MYSVFLVEDEIVVREGIRTSIPWDKTQYTLAGEAPDGEMALSILREIRPDILITDIKMPFMDGLALARIVKKDQPWLKIIILSGHDEFQYAKEAISIGVEEYLLKPVSAREMLESLDKVARQIEEERRRLTSIENLRMKIRSTEEIVRERWLHDLISGQVTAGDAFETARGLGMDLVANGYVVVVIELTAGADLQAQTAAAKNVIASIVQGRTDLVLFSRSAEKPVILFKNVGRDTPDDTVYSLARTITFETERNTGCRVAIGIGPVVEHICQIGRSYAEAERAIRCSGAGEDSPQRSRHHEMIRKAKRYIDEHYMDQDISLNTVASVVNVSPNHFSTIFSQETGGTFIERLTTVRIENAKRLLRDSGMKSSDIAYEVGFSDPHYFSFIFKKHTGLSPREFRTNGEPSGQA